LASLKGIGQVNRSAIAPKRFLIPLRCAIKRAAIATPNQQKPVSEGLVAGRDRTPVIRKAEIIANKKADKDLPAG